MVLPVVVSLLTGREKGWPPMPRTVLDNEIRVLNAQITQLGSLVDNALAKTRESLETSDLSISNMVIEVANKINNLCAVVEKHSIRLLILQQPLAGRDMRYLTASLHVIANLGRCGEATAEIAQMILRIAALHDNAASQGLARGRGLQLTGEQGYGTEDFALRGLYDLGAEVQYMLQKTLEAFTKGDVQVARYIAQEDDFMDVRYQRVCQDLMTMLAGAAAISALQRDSYILQRATYLLWIAHRLEQIASNATNICKRVVFIVEGENTDV